MFKKYKKKLNFTGRINAFRVIERLERMNILCGQNTESVNYLIVLSEDPLTTNLSLYCKQAIPRL